MSEVAKAVEILKNVSLFEDLSNEELDRIASLAKTQEHKKNEKLFSEGETGNALYMISTGKIRIAKTIPGIGEEALAILEPGAFFGEMALLDDTPRSADAIVHEACELLVIERAPFESLLFVDKELAYHVLSGITRVLASRLRETNDKIAAFFAMTKFG